MRLLKRFPSLQYCSALRPIATVILYYDLAIDMSYGYDDSLYPWTSTSIQQALSGDTQPKIRNTYEYMRVEYKYETKVLDIEIYGVGIALTCDAHESWQNI